MTTHTIARASTRTATVRLQSTAGAHGPAPAHDAYNCFTYRAPPRHAPTTSSAPSPSCTGTGTSTAPGTARLHSWPISIKDNFCTRDMPTTCASRMLQGYTSSFDAAAVSLLRGEGAHIVGKTNCDEFGMGSANVHSFYGAVLNPAGPGSGAGAGAGSAGQPQAHTQAERRAAGGSSGGAAASVRAGLCRVALGSDTGGSIRLPAAYCGVWGLKPSYGLVSRWGLVSYADSLDTVGVLARSWRDCREALGVLGAYDERDPTSASREVRRRADETARGVLAGLRGGQDGPLAGLRIGIPRECFPAELDAQVLPPFEAAVAFLEERGAQVLPVSLPNLPLGLSAYYVIASAEASSNLARYDGVRYGHRADAEGEGEGEIEHEAHPYAATRSEGFGEEVKRRILLGTHALSAHAFENTFLRAQSIRRLIQSDFDAVFRAPNVLRATSTPTRSPPSSSSSSSSSPRVDVLLHPSSVSTAPPLPPPPPLPLDEAPTSTYTYTYTQDVLTVPASLAGVPAVSMPVGDAADGWPVGVMAVAQWGMEDVLGVVGEAMEEFAGRGA